MTTRQPSGPPGPDDADAASLLGRWQAHHDAGPAAAEDAGAVDPAAAALPATSRRPKHAAPRRQVPDARATDSVAISREVLTALGRAEAAVAPPGRSRPRATSGPEVGASVDVDFEPRLGARRVVGLLLLGSLAATAGAAYLAYQDARPLSLGAAGTLLVLSLLLYAVRAGSAPTYLAIRSGQLEVRRAQSVELFDLASPYTPVEVVGRPGRPGWKVVLGRLGREPLVLSSSLVDPKQFMHELERYRPADRRAVR